MPRPDRHRTFEYRVGFGLLCLTATVIAGLLIWHLFDIILLIFAAILVAILLRSLAGLIRRVLPIGRRVSLAMAVLIILGLSAGFFLLLGAQLRTQALDLIERAPDLIEPWGDWLGIDDLEAKLRSRAEETVEEASLMKDVAGFSFSFTSILGEILLVLVAGVYIAFGSGTYSRGLRSLFPPPARATAGSTIAAIGRALRLWLAGQLVAMILVGVLTTIGLWLLGVPSVLLLGLIAGVLEFVPFIGPFASAVPAIAIAAAEDTGLILWVAGLYLLVQQIEGNLITPLVQQQTVDLPPAVTMFAIVSFGYLFGLLGVFLATPLAVVCMVLVKKLWLNEALGEETELPGTS